MTEAQFVQQMNRLAETFDAKHYKPERVKLIQQKVMHLSGEWFTRVVDSFIASSRNPPLVADFEEPIAIERERLWRMEKEQNEREAKSFMSAASFKDDEVKSIVSTIVKRSQGEVNDNDWQAFMRVLNHTVGKGDGK